ncbi:MAG: low molecular weight phosphotyrosine protein phosphatase [Sphaerochaetaceae bacterium]|nr:low molecular weight phosphotyrosine protein phosphatase [Sphaerochaetaceae bacterium]
MERKVKVLFVCHGNICRSPMAQYVFTQLADKAGVLDQFEIDSAATSTEEIGNPVYPPARRMLAMHGITKMDHRARQMTMQDYRYYDVIRVMDMHNVYNARRMTGGDPEGKICMLLDREVSDPWYTDDFASCYEDILEGCENLLEELL